ELVRASAADAKHFGGVTEAVLVPLAYGAGHGADGVLEERGPVCIHEVLDRVRAAREPTVALDDAGLELLGREVGEQLTHLGSDLDLGLRVVLLAPSLAHGLHHFWLAVLA